jgi:long-chain acyl-CoA synthetase
LCAEAECFRDTVGVSDEDVILCVVPLSHAHGLGNGLLASLRSGAALVLMESFDRRRVMRTLEAEGVTIFPGVPFMFKILAETSLPNVPDLSVLRLCFSAGAPLTRQTFTAFRDRFGIPVRQLYGSSETGAVSINLDDDIDRLWGSVGPPLVGMDIQIFDDAGQPLGPDQEGAVGIQSPSMFGGYATPGGLRRDAIRGGYFFPGDRGRRDAQGRITLTGRETLFINVGGNKVDPAEVESVLASHPAVREAVVLGTRGASGDEVVKAVVVLEQPAEEAELIAHCRERVAGFKVPRVVELRDELPRNPLGKLLRKYLE